jgi:hypothetical protein
MIRLRSTYRVQSLLETLEPAAVLQEAAADFRRRYAYKRRWDEALLTPARPGLALHLSR